MLGRGGVHVTRLDNQVSILVSIVFWAVGVSWVYVCFGRHPGQVGQLRMHARICRAAHDAPDHYSCNKAVESPLLEICVVHLDPRGWRSQLFGSPEPYPNPDTGTEAGSCPGRACMCCPYWFSLPPTDTQIITGLASHALRSRGIVSAMWCRMTVRSTERSAA